MDTKATRETKALTKNLRVARKQKKHEVWGDERRAMDKDRRLPKVEDEEYQSLRRLFGDDMFSNDPVKKSEIQLIFDMYNGDRTLSNFASVGKMETGKMNAFRWGLLKMKYQKLCNYLEIMSEHYTRMKLKLALQRCAERFSTLNLEEVEPFILIKAIDVIADVVDKYKLSGGTEGGGMETKEEIEAAKERIWEFFQNNSVFLGQKADEGGRIMAALAAGNPTEVVDVVPHG